MEGIGNTVGFTDPVFQAKFEKKFGLKVEDNIMLASREWAATCFSGKAHKWSEIKHLQEHWDGPMVLKGIQSVDDALLAVEAGVQGIVCSPNPV